MKGRLVLNFFKVTRYTRLFFKSYPMERKGKMKMNKEKVGFILFVFGVVYLLVMSGGGGWFIKSSPAQILETTNMIDIAAYFFWAFSAALASIIAGVGMLLYIRSKGSHIVLYAIGVFLAFFFLGFLLHAPGLTVPHYPPFYGLGGGLILIFFLAILWLWGKQSKTLEGPVKTAAEYQLVSYVFFLLATWYLCGTFSALFKWTQIRSPIDIMIFLVLGWLFLFLSHFKQLKIC